MSDQPIHRGGSHTARRLHLKGIVLHVSAEEHALLQAAARTAGKTLKAFCTEAALAALKKRG